MGFYKLSLLTTAFSHLMKIVKETDKIAEIDAQKISSVEDKTTRLSDGIPYMSKREKTMKKIIMNKKSFSQEFSLKKILNFLIKEDVGDMAVGDFSLIVRDGVIKEVCEKFLGKKIVDNRFILKFLNNPEAGKEYNIREKIILNMKMQIEKLDFKVASLDLVGIYAYEDYVKDKQLNLLDEIKKNEKTLREIADEYFNEFIIIGGVQKKIRATKYYEMGNKNMPILKDVKVF